MRSVRALVLMATLMGTAFPAAPAAEKEDVQADARAMTQLYVRTIPSGAKVLVDGQPPAESDCLLELEGVESVTVVVELKGYEGERRRVTLETGKIERIEIFLKKAEGAEPQAMANSNDAKLGSGATARPGPRRFVRLVVGPDQLTFEGSPATWESLPEPLQQIQDRPHTVLEVAIASDHMTVKQRDEALARAISLARQYGFEYASFIGVHPLGSKGSPTEMAGPEPATSEDERAVRRTVMAFSAAANAKHRDEAGKYIAPRANVTMSAVRLPTELERVMVQGDAALAITTPMKLDAPEASRPFRVGYALVRADNRWLIKQVMPIEDNQMPAEAEWREFLNKLSRPEGADEAQAGREADVRNAAKSLADDILQRGDPALRNEALTRVREMLAGSSPAQGLAALAAALPAKFDRGPFRPLVIPLLKSEDEVVREIAVRVLPGLDATAADLDHLLPLVDDASARVRSSIAGSLIQIDQGKRPDKVTSVLTRLLRDSDSKVVEATLRSMWGQYSSPEFDELLIELSRQPEHHGSAIYFALSTMKSKSPAVARRLVEELADPDWNNSGRAAWGLTYGLTAEAKPIVEEGLLRALPEETNAYTRSQQFRALRGVATEKSREYLKSVSESQQETDEFKQQAAEILMALEEKEG